MSKPAFAAALDVSKCRRAVSLVATGSGKLLPWPSPAPRIGVIHNARARHNVGRPLPLVIPGCEHVMPATHQELHDVLAEFVATGLDALIIDGGDGTIRDILSVIARYFPGFAPRVAIVPSGKTNALAHDLGVPADWTVARAIEAVVVGHTALRSAIEIRRNGAAHVELMGLIFGTGAFVRATQLAQTTHRMGAFNGLAVGMSILGGVGQTILGRRDNVWRRGEAMQVRSDGLAAVDAAHYLLFASTLQRLPLGVRPFGTERPGLKVLRIESPARRMLRAMPIILSGAERPWLRSAGYHQDTVERIDVSLAGEFVLDGEAFEGGDLSLRKSAPIAFAVP